LMLESWNDRCEPPWEKEELERICNNAASYKQNSAGVESAASDFEDAPEVAEDNDWLENGLQSPKLNEVSGDNIDDVFKLVNVSGKTKIMYWGKSPIDSNVRVAEFWSEEELHRALRNKFITVEKKTKQGDKITIDKKRMPLSEWWLQKRERYTYDGLIFDSKAEDVSETDEINLWRGFAVQPAEGDWSLMRDHIRTIIANDVEEHADYILRWFAWAIQHPTEPAEVALALAGGPGTGKGIVGRANCRAYGPHGLHISKPGLLTGKFNAHFMQCSFLFADEAIWPGHKDQEGTLKAMLTEPTMTIEPKGINPFSMPNCVKLFMASNEKWVAPVGVNDRRFAVFQVSEERRQDRKYFGKIQRQLNDGGLAAMLYDFLNWDLQGWHPSSNIPHTNIRGEQQQQSAPPELKWLAGYLESGVLDWQHEKRPNAVAAGQFYQHARQSVKGLSFWTDYDFAKYLDKWGVLLKRSNGAWRVFPPLADMRAEWIKRNPGARGMDQAQSRLGRIQSQDEGVGARLKGITRPTCPMSVRSQIQYSIYLWTTWTDWTDL
jgi:hypothetical protein